ncbi:hypothetical protein LTR28_002762, partial [Elasticomyces elasticus]
MRGLNQVTFNSASTQVTYGGGTLISEVVDAAAAQGVEVQTGNCNCVGTIGAILGGGYGRTMGIYGFGVDNLISVNIVTDDGLLTVSASSHPELWWAIRGAGANFGVVTSVTARAYPAPDANAWVGELVYTEDKIEAVVSAIQRLTLAAPMALFLYYATTGFPDYTPLVVASPYYHNGTVTQGQAAFSSLYDIGPIVDTTAVLPYNKVNSGADSFCVKGGRKPTYGVGFDVMDTAIWRQIWKEYTTFLQNPGTGSSVVLLEAYSLAYPQSIPDSSSAFPHRHVRFHAIAVPWYSDAHLDTTAQALGSS